MTTLLAVLGGALLFALAAVALPQRRSCGGNCGSCASACDHDEAEAPRAH